MNLNIVLTSWQLKCSQLKLSLCLQVTLELKNNNIPHVHNLMKTSWMAQNNLHVEKRTLSGSSCEMGNSCGKDAILPFLYLKQKVFAAAKSLQSCPTLWPHRWQPTRLPCPLDSPGKNTGVGCHFEGSNIYSAGTGSISEQGWLEESWECSGWPTMTPPLDFTTASYCICSFLTFSQFSTQRAKCCFKKT